MRVKNPQGVPRCVSKCYINEWPACVEGYQKVYFALRTLNNHWVSHVHVYECSLEYSCRHGRRMFPRVSLPWFRVSCRSRTSWSLCWGDKRWRTSSELPSDAPRSPITTSGTRSVTRKQNSICRSCVPKYSQSLHSLWSLEAQSHVRSCMMAYLAKMYHLKCWIKRSL